MQTNKKILILISIFLFLVQDLIAKDYEFSMNPRRRYDQIHVELWVKKLSTDAPIIGNTNLYISYNSTRMELATNQTPSTADSIHADPYRTNPIVNISSQFHGTNGFSILQVSENNDYAGLLIRLQNIGEGGVNVRETGRGTYLGKIILDIISQPGDEKMDLDWSKESTGPVLLVRDIDNINITEKCKFTKPTSENIVGVKILSLLNDDHVIDFDHDYNSLGTLFKGYGFPIFFERSIDPVARSRGLDINNAYVLEYTLEGSDWKELGRIAENSFTANSLNTNFLTGQIGRPAGGSGRAIATYKGQTITSNNYRDPLRILWRGSGNDKFRSSETKIRISLLEGETDTTITTREKTGQQSQSIGEVSSGTHFFPYFNGSGDHFRSTRAFSTPTQFTVEAWVNPNSISGNERGIVCSSAGPDGTPINGKKEGAWLLYLKDGKYPAFRVRELMNRGPNEYLADLVAEDQLKASSIDEKSDDHSYNWTHIAGVVKDNKAWLYVNGELVAHYENTLAGNIRTIQTDHYVYVGTNPNGGFSNNNFFNGGIKEVKIWRIALEQDQIIRYAGGINRPDSILTIDDFKTGLDIYYKFQGTPDDHAYNPEYQDGSNNAIYFNSRTQLEDKENYLPDIPHAKIVSPVSGTGLLNSPGTQYKVKYISYGLGNNSLGLTEDLELEYSTDGGAFWADMRNSNGVQLGGSTAPDSETGFANWVPYRNNDTGADIRRSTPFSKEILIRATGHDDWGQSSIRSDVVSLKTSRFQSLDKDLLSKIFIKDNVKLDIDRNGLFVEAWIRPHRFPTDGEDIFPIIAKADSVDGNISYLFGLNQEGRLEINFTDTSNKIVRIISDENRPLTEPLSISKDTIWHHVAAFIDPTSSNRSFFMVDGFYQSSSLIDNRKTDSTVIETSNNGDVFIGYLPQLPQNDNRKGYEGQLRELRIWKGLPMNYSFSVEGLDSLKDFVQGSMSLYLDQFSDLDTLNVITSFSFNGGLFSYDGETKSIASSIDSTIVAKIHNAGVVYVPTEPYLRVVEPTLAQRTNQEETSLRVRWIGFNYDPTGFESGRFSTPPSIEFSPNGGGGQDKIPYQYVGSSYWPGNTQNAFIFPDSSKYRFTLHGGTNYYAGSLNISMTDPDIVENDPVNRQGPFPIALTNARLRLTGRYTIESDEFELRSESDLFSVYPGSNLTVRVLKEALHNGSTRAIQQIDTSYQKGGIKISLYFDEGGKPGVLATEATPVSSYEDLSSTNLNFGSNRFANLTYVVTEIPDGNYWLVAESQNYLPVMSRFPVPFKFEGDDKSTWEIESGWDFVSWNGDPENILPSIDSISSIGNRSYYTAYGMVNNSSTSTERFETALILNDGLMGGNDFPLPSIIAGDIDNNGVIDQSDITLARQKAGVIGFKYDMNGDSLCNAIERNLISRNLNYTSSISSILNKAKKEDLSLNKSDKIDKIQFSSFKISTAVERIGDQLILEFYISNIGDDVSISNASFAFTIDTSKVEFSNFEVSEYFETYSGDQEASRKDLLSIEIERTNDPILIPTLRTSLGKFYFDIDEDVSIVEFEWHNSSIAFDERGDEIISSSVLEDIQSYISFDAMILSPNGGEIFGPGDIIEIEWSNKGESVDLQFYDGTSWNDINSLPLENNITTIQYQLPFVTGSNYKIRMLDSKTSIVIDITNNFSIQEKFGQIVSPSSNDDIFEGGSETTIFWIISGYSNYSIDLSTDNGINWDIQFSSLKADQSSIQWTLPRITTDRALLRLRSGEDIIDISESFKIKTGYVDLRTPVSGETIYIDEITRIIWLYDDLNEFDLEYSSDGGSSWNPIATTKASKRFYDWKVNSDVSNNALIRAVWNSNSEFEYDRSGFFSVEKSTSVENENFQCGKFKLITPLPINDSAEVEVETNHDVMIALSIVDLNGIVYQLDEQLLRKGLNRFTLNLSELNSGTYYVRIVENTNSTVLPLIISR